MEGTARLGDDLRSFWERFRKRFRTQTRDTSEYGYHYLSGLLRMDTKRNISNIGRQTEVPKQNLHHFMSNSPWSGSAVIAQVQDEIAERPELQRGAMLVLDESADEKAGTDSVGAGRQYNGRMGTVTESQVGVFVAIAKEQSWTWVDGELYLPEAWFTEEYADKRAAVGLPVERAFATKIELGWQLIQRVKAKGLPFEAVACDDLYGRSGWLRDQMEAAGIEYYADVPRNTLVYLNKPEIGIPKPEPGQPGPKPRRKRVLSPHPYHVCDLVDHPEMRWQQVLVRPTERGNLHITFAARRVWTVRDDLSCHPEWLLIRRYANGSHSYSFSNAPADTPIEILAARKTQRYFVERTNQDNKSELGWDEFEARKWRAWQHHLALTILASWFITETKLNWVRDFSHDPALLEQFEVDVLPTLSYANVRTLLCAVLPLPQLSPSDAAALVVEHLTNRARSRRSRLKKTYSSKPPP
jgi:SRSO17 transposase